MISFIVAGNEQCRDIAGSVRQRMFDDVECVREYLDRIHAVANSDDEISVPFRNNNAAKLLLFLVVSVLKPSPLRDTLFMWSSGCQSLCSRNQEEFLEFIA